MVFDTHFHLDLQQDPQGIVREIECQKIYTIAVTNLPELFLHTENLCKNCKYIRPALGYHPELAAAYSNQLPLFDKLSDKTKYIGEIGLDNLRKTTKDFAEQKRVFEHILTVCALKKDKILTVHSRRAEQEVIAMVGNNFPGKVILHWYSGSLKTLNIALEYGFYLSVNLNMTLSDNGRKIIKALPMERILLETDGPFTNAVNRTSLPMDTALTQAEVLTIKSAVETNSKSSAVLFKNFTDLLSMRD